MYAFTQISSSYGSFFFSNDQTGICLCSMLQRELEDVSGVYTHSLAVFEKGWSELEVGKLHPYL